MRVEPTKTNSALWSGTETVMEEKEKEEEIVLGSPVLGAGLKQSYSSFHNSHLVVLLKTLMI